MFDVKITASDYIHHDTHVMNVHFSENVTISFDSNIYEMDRYTFAKETKSYKMDNYCGGQLFFDRPFYKHFNINNTDSLFSSLVRTLAITSINFNYNIENDSFSDSVDKFNNYFYDMLNFDWTGETQKSQPYIYFLSLDLIKQDQEALTNLVKKGVIYTFENVTNSLTAYFVPLDFSDFPSLTNKREEKLWNEIKKRINYRIKRMIHQGGEVL